MSENFPVELWEIGSIKPYDRNAKIHNDDQVEKLATAIKTFGWTQPIVVDKDGVIIAGHGRRLAALKLKLAKVPVICRRDLSKSQADALRLADNRVTSVEYDMSLIQDELRALADSLNGEFVLSDLGFDEKELDFTLADLSEIDNSFFVDDVGDAVEQQKAENKELVEQIDDIAAPVGDALGFKRVTIAQSREIRSLMGKIEAATGMKGADALIAFVAGKL